MPKYQAENDVSHCPTEGYERPQPHILVNVRQTRRRVRGRSLQHGQIPTCRPCALTRRRVCQIFTFAGIESANQLTVME
jgi:hypothetical protein